MKRILGMMLVGAIALVPQLAAARDYCLLINSNNITFKAFTPPGKGACKPVEEVSTTFAGLVSTGAACTTTDGKTLLFTLTDGFFSGLETIQGSITLSSGSGSGNDCVASGGGSTDCNAVSFTVQSCPKKAPPITDVTEDSAVVRSSHRSQGSP